MSGSLLPLFSSQTLLPVKYNLVSNVSRWPGFFLEMSVSVSLSPLLELSGEIGWFLFSTCSCSWKDFPLFHDFSILYLHVSHTARLVSPSKISTPTAFSKISANSPTMFRFLFFSVNTNPHSLQQSRSLDTQGFIMKNSREREKQLYA